MDKVIMCGLDLHERKMTCQIGAGKSKPMVAEFGNTPRGRQKMFRLLKAKARVHETDRIVLAYEASGLGFGLYDECVKEAIECYVLAPTKIRKGQDEKKRKDDKRDAKMILETLRGHVLAGNDLPTVWIPDHETRDDREITRGRLDAGEKVGRLKTQIRMLLKRTGSEKPKEAGEAWSICYRQWLETLQLRPGARFALSRLLNELAFAEEQLEAWDREMSKLAKTDRYCSAMKALDDDVDGVGIVTGMVFLTELGDLTRFANRKQVGGFVGLTPGSNETGENDDRKGHITHDGPARLRKVLCQASWVRVRVNDKEGKGFERICKGSDKRRKIAIVAVMRRLAIIMWHVALDAQRSSLSCQNAA